MMAKLAAEHDSCARLRRSNGEQTYTALLEAALSIWSKQGVQSVTMNAVAAAAGKTRGTVYHHFADRDELLKAARQHLDARLAKLFGDAHQEQGNPYELVAGLAASSPELIGTYIRDMLEADPREHPIIQGGIAHFQRMDRDGLLKPGVDPVHAALATLSMWFAAILAVSLKSDPDERHVEAGRFADSFRYFMFNGAIDTSHYPADRP